MSTARVLQSPSLAARAVWPLTIATALAVAAALFLPTFGVDGSRYPFLVISSCGFLAVAIAAGALGHAYGRLALGGLFFCWLGDVLGPYSFELGSSMFLLAHLVFIAAFFAVGIDWARSLRTAWILIVSAGVLIWLVPQIDEPFLRGLVLAYTTVITLMVLAAGGTTRFILLAAIVFFLSDVFLARWKFVDSDGSNAFLCYPLYYTACLLFAHSIYRVGRKSSSPAVPDAAGA